MIQSFENIVPIEYTDIFKKSWIEQQDKKFVNWYDDQDQTVNDPDLIIDERIEYFPGSEEYALVEELVKKIRPDADYILAYYQRQSKPHQIHLDDLEGCDHTMVIPLNHNPEAKVLVWKPYFDNVEEFRDYLTAWGQSDSLPLYNISESYDIEHTIDQNNGKYLSDYMELEGVYSYNLGSMGMFTSKQLHCSSDWTKIPGQKFKELVIVHTN